VADNEQTINGKTYDSGSVSIRMGSSEALLKSISFGDGLNTEDVRRIGEQEIAAITEGEYSVEPIKVTLEKTVWDEKLLPKLPKNGYGNFPFPIVGSYGFTGQPKHTIRAEQCRIVKVNDNVEAGPGAVMVELEIKSKQIVRDGKTINRRKGVTPSATDQTMKL
jgi:hypothetical protein